MPIFAEALKFMKVRTRFAPSPTGYLHIGGARTALFSWLYAKKLGGEFVLRIEDTDRERSTEESVQAILDGMGWLDLAHDEGPFYQTERFDRYKEVTEKLLTDGHAYPCYCSRERLDEVRAKQMANKEKPRYDGCCRAGVVNPPEGVSPVIRFKNPQEGSVVIDDLIKGRVVVNNCELDDLIIARSDGTPTYNLTVVVDDFDMQISHVIRGDDHLNNTPRQINILNAMGATLPQYAHVPMILGEDGKRLSKRHGAVSVMQYFEEGFLPEALLNYLMRLGWSHGDQEIFSRAEMTELFDLKDVNVAASTFNPEKLLWLNQHYIKTSDTSYLGGVLKTYLAKLGCDCSQGPELAKVVEAQRERAKTMVEMADNSLFFYADFTEFDEKAAKKNFKAAAQVPLQSLKAALSEVSEWQAEPLHEAVMAVAETLELKLGKVAQPLRVAVAGKGISPPIDITLELLGRERTLARIEMALAFIEQRIQAG